MHSSRMRTTRSSSCPGGSPPGTSREQTPPGADPPPPQSRPPTARHAGIPPAMHAGMPPPPVNRMTDRCKNITLPQTSFAGGKNSIVEHTKRQSWHDIYPNITNFVHF